MGRPRKKPAEGEILIATDSGTTTLDGEEFIFHKGVTRVRVGHKLARALPQYFEPISVHYDVEQMTAGPGEKRGT